MAVTLWASVRDLLHVPEGFVLALQVKPTRLHPFPYPFRHGLPYLLRRGLEPGWEDVIFPKSNGPHKSVASM